MNHYIELLLAASIVVLLMHVPEFLQEMAASSLGKMLLLSVVVFLLCFCGKNAAIESITVLKHLFERFLVLFRGSDP